MIDAISKKVSNIDSNQYFVRGSTAMLDAVGKTINYISAKLAKFKENERPSKVIFVIITDGMENASIEFTQSQVKQMIEHQEKKYSREVMFLGANIDSAQVASSYGIRREMAVDFCTDEGGVQLNYAELEEAICQMRSGEIIGAE